MNKNKRPQAPKSGNRAMNQAFQELRRSSAAEPHKSKKSYNRRDKSWKNGY